MDSLHDQMAEYKRLMAAGTMPRAYQGLMVYMQSLRTELARRHPDHVVSGSVYPGVMDMTYFALTPPAIAARQLKIAVVFVHAGCRFEVWLAAQNKAVQGKYWTLIQESGWKQYRLVESTQGYDSILVQVLAAEPDWGDLAALSGQIEHGTLAFSADVAAFLESPAGLA